MTMRYKLRGCRGLIWGSMCAKWMSSLESDFRKIQLEYALKKKVHIVYVYTTQGPRKHFGSEIQHYLLYIPFHV